MNLSIEKFARKNLFYFAFISVIVVVLSLIIIISSFTDILNMFFSPFVFDLKRAESEKSLVSLIPAANSTQIIDEFGLNKGYNIEEYQSLVFSEKYIQSGKYIFKIKPDKIYDIGLRYKTEYSIENTPVWSGTTHKYLLCQLDNALFFANVPYDYVVSTGDTLTGVFTIYSDTTISDIKKVFSKYESIDNLFTYQFDTTISFFPEMASSFIWSTICFFISLFLVIRLILQIKYHSKRPLYKKINMLDGDITIINEELKSAVYSNKSYITKDWIITPRLFKTQITRNISF
ncbi:MAG: hypothetical protein FWC47_14835 [Oscillospiraceae bacterium]|nr:hypothetical protein [Oscillospiraceae bacterium]